ncbi:amino acid adenylation domain-containing protein [Amycolatopsis sp. GA6-003]|uniref:amino acid adenylation domain-containing protein n=1 Tax=Amycolatopsis sp. GA6-003 TaxID=2652444 RepID=UPI0039175780
MAAEPETLPALVARQAVGVPDLPAVRLGRRWLTYAELDSAADRLARRLRARGVGAEDVVGVHTGRALSLPVAILGVLKAGAAYLPLPADLPSARLAELLGDAGAVAVVTRSSLRSGLTESPCTVMLVDDEPDVGTADPLPDPDPDTAAYVIYTSGSTGTPKGVVVSHRAAVAHLLAMAARLGVGFGDGVLQMAGEAFDVAVEQLFLPLATGAVCVLRGEEPWGPAEVRAELCRGWVTVADLPTALFSELVGQAGAGGLAGTAERVRAVLVGGETLLSGVLTRWHAALGATSRPELFNAYGPTETVMTSTLYRANELAGERLAASVPIGSLVGPRRLHVLDDDLNAVEGGTPGQLYLAGDAVARGYLRRPGLTAERFVPDPAGLPGTRMYRTGDRVVADPGSGELTFLGRFDDQVKVRGFRVEPAELTAALTAHPAIGHAAITADDGRLACYLVPAEPGVPVSLAVVRDWLSRRVPSWMLPAKWAWLDRLPVTPSGKVDRAALPLIEPRRAVSSAPYAEPDGDLARTLCLIWGRILNLPEIGVHDDFFEVGGTSLLAARALAELRHTVAADLPLHALFAAPTPAKLAAVIENGTWRGHVLPPVVPTGQDSSSPLSLMQRQVWVVEQLSPGTSAYNAPTTLRMRGPLNIALLERALSEIVRRHEILRTTIETSGDEPVQLVHPPYPVIVPVVDLRDEPDPETASERFVCSEISVGFDLSRLPLIRWTALRLADELYELVLVEHHLVHDGWSFAVLVGELATIYTAFDRDAPDPLPERTVQYRDFARWQREVLPGPAMRAQLSYWRKQLAGAPQVLELPHDRPRVPKDDTPGAVHRVELPAELCSRLREFSRASGTTLFMTMLAGYAALLHRYSGQDEVCVGSAFGNRGVGGTSGIIGMFVNPVVLRCEVRDSGGAEATFESLLGRVRKVVLDAQANQDFPFVELVKELKPLRAPGRNPMFQAMLNFDDAPLTELAFGPVTGTYLERNNGTAKLDLSLLVVPRAERQLGLPARDRDHRITLIWEYRSDLFDQETVERLAEGYRDLLDAATAGPRRAVAELPLGAAGPGRTEEPAVLGAPATLPGLFDAVAAKHPGRIAVKAPGEPGLSYGELDRRAAGLAKVLLERGVTRDSLVAVCLPRSVEQVVAVLAVLKAGAAYLPLDPATPSARLSDILRDAAPRVVLLASAAEPPDSDIPTLVVGDVAGADPSTVDSARNVDPDDLAYVIYTSGSTGRPKGVGISHRALTDKYRAWQSAYGLDGTAARHLQLASVAFDVCAGDIVRALLSGGLLVLCPPEVVLDPAALLTLLEDERIEYAEFLPSVLRLLADHLETVGGRLPPVRLLAVGGEAWSREDYRRFQALTSPGTRIFNVYGVTEATIGNTWHRPSDQDDDLMPIGVPLPGVSASVLDTAGASVPPGVVGELHLGGTGLARGYQNDPVRTAERFVPHPSAPGQRLYATGDLARYRPGGEIVLFGRADRQLKIRGFRVEPAEVEQAIARHPSVADAAVVPIQHESGIRLAGYCVPSGDWPEPGDVLDWLRQSVPAYLVPSSLQMLPRLPRTASGKVDRVTLAEDAERTAPAIDRPAAYIAPRTAAEGTMAAIWGQVLGVDRVGADDDFFDLGGHSLLAVRLVARVRAELGVEVSVRDLVAAPTVAGMVSRSAAASAAGVGPDLKRRRRLPADPRLFDLPRDAS